MLKNYITAPDLARCGGARINIRQINDKPKYRKKMQTKKGSSAERRDRVKGVIGAPAGKQEAGWTRKLEFETQSMKGGLLPHRTCLLCCRNSISHFCCLCFERESQKMGKCKITVMGCYSQRTELPIINTSAEKRQHLWFMMLSEASPLLSLHRPPSHQDADLYLHCASSSTPCSQCPFQHCSTKSNGAFQHGSSHFGSIWFRASPSSLVYIAPTEETHHPPPAERLFHTVHPIMSGVGLMTAGLPARLRVIRHTLTKLQQLTETERALITKGHQGGLPSLTGWLSMRCSFTPNGPLKVFEQSSTPQISSVGCNFVPRIQKFAIGLVFQITVTKHQHQNWFYNTVGLRSK